jgi:Na+/melibiose symporter-like transporter
MRELKASPGICASISPGGRPEGDHALKALSESDVYRDYAPAFFRGRRPASDTRNVIRHRRNQENPFCALMAKTSDTCSKCNDLQAGSRSPRLMSKASIWIPLKNRMFRNLWVASLLSGSAVSAYDMAATWLMNTMTPSPLLLSLMSTFATLPFFLFTLPAGVFADMFDRRKLLCFMNLWLAMVAAGLAIANWLGLANPYLILGTVFLLGIGFAFNAPADGDR